jgi:hypothetical protein
MPTEGQQPEGSLDLILAGANRNAQNLVVADSHNLSLKGAEEQSPGLSPAPFQEQNQKSSSGEHPADTAHPRGIAKNDRQVSL